MPAEDRARKPGAEPSAPQGTDVPTGGPTDGTAGPAGVSMRALLDSCAAADAVSTPPTDDESLAESADGEGRRGHPGAGDEPARGAEPTAHPGQDAA